MSVAHGCGRRRRELRFPEGLAPRLFLGLTGACSRVGRNALGLGLSCLAAFILSSSSLTNQCYVMYAVMSTMRLLIT